MSEFIPKGYELLDDVRERIGLSELRAKLACAELRACCWNKIHGTLAPVPAHEWARQGSVKHLRRGYWDSRTKALLVAHRYSPKPAPPPPSHQPKGGRPRYDWDAFHREVIRIANSPDGLPDKQAELERIMLGWCERQWDGAGESTIRAKVSAIFNVIRPRPET